MRRSSFFLALVLVVGGGLVGTFQQRRLASLRVESATLTANIAESHAVAAELEQRLTQMRNERASILRASTSASLAATDTVRDIDQLTAAQRFDRPPAEVPAWDPDSPFIWLRKDQLSHLPIHPFEKHGGLDGDVARVLTLTPEEISVLNGRLQSIVRAFQAQEATHAEMTDQHLPGIAGKEGTPLSVIIQPFPEEGRAAQETFTAAIRQALGEQRSSLVLGSGEDWLNSTFSQSGTQPVTISVLRRPGGTYDVSIKRGWGWMSTGGFDWNGLQNYIPAGILPRFVALAPERE